MARNYLYLKILLSAGQKKHFCYFPEADSQLLGGLAHDQALETPTLEQPKEFEDNHDNDNHSNVPADCYSVEQHPIKIEMAAFRQPVPYLSVEMLRTNKDPRTAIAAKPSPCQVPKSKEPSPAGNIKRSNFLEYSFLSVV
jgi:hypothetical protein